MTTSPMIRSCPPTMRRSPGIGNGASPRSSLRSTATASRGLSIWSSGHRGPALSSLQTTTALPSTRPRGRSSLRTPSLQFESRATSAGTLRERPLRRSRGRRDESRLQQRRQCRRARSRSRRPAPPTLSLAYRLPPRPRCPFHRFRACSASHSEHLGGRRSSCRACSGRRPREVRSSHDPVRQRDPLAARQATSHLLEELPQRRGQTQLLAGPTTLGKLQLSSRRRRRRSQPR